MKKIKKNIVKILCIGSIVMCPISAKADVIHQDNSIIFESQTEVRADEIRYRYKIVDGKTYRRLFNYSKNQWIGQWELCK